MKNNGVKGMNRGGLTPTTSCLVLGEIIAELGMPGND